MERDPCFTCFPSSNNKVVCVEHKSKDSNSISLDEEKIVRQFMHPTDGVQYTLWLFEAQFRCFNTNSKSERAKILEDFSNSIIKRKEIVFREIN